MGTARDRLAAGGGPKRKSGGGGTHTHGRNCREENYNDGDTRIKKGMGEEASLGASGSSGEEWSMAKD